MRLRTRFYGIPSLNSLKNIGSNRLRVENTVSLAGANLSKHEKIATVNIHG